MQIIRTTATLAAVLLLGACASAADQWTHASLAAAQQQQERDKCHSQSVEAESSYVRTNSRGSVNSTTPLINNLKVRQQALAERNKVYAECMRGAGFTQGS